MYNDNTFVAVNTMYSTGTVFEFVFILVEFFSFAFAAVYMHIQYIVFMLWFACIFVLFFFSLLLLLIFAFCIFK